MNQIQIQTIRFKNEAIGLLSHSIRRIQSVPSVSGCGAGRVPQETPGSSQDSSPKEHAETDIQISMNLSGQA
jgi:hypothetical protein